MADPDLDLVVADWRDAVHAYLESPRGRSVFVGLSAAERPIFVALLETMVPVPASTETDIVHVLDKWRISRERELRTSFGINLYATSDAPPTETLVIQRFIDLKDRARGNIRDVERFVGQKVSPSLRGIRDDLRSGADSPTVRPDFYPTSPVEYDDGILDLMRTRESVPDGVELARLEADLSLSLETVTASRSGEMRAMNPPALEVDITTTAPRSPAPSLESFGFGPSADGLAKVCTLDDPLSSDLEPGKSHPPPVSDADAPSIEVGEGVELEDGDGLGISFEDDIGSVPSRK